MAQPRVDALVARLEKGAQRTSEAFGSLTAEQWQATVYAGPNWSVRDLLAHFVSAEEQLLALAQYVAAGGAGAPPGFDIHAFNAKEQQRLAGRSRQELLDALNACRRQTLVWVRTLEDSQLDRRGCHPGLGDVSLETMILAMYGHQLLHMRDLAKRLSGISASG